MTECVVIPAYNESSKIINVISEVKRYCNNIIIVDDGSKDNTYNLAKQTGATVLKHSVNLGKGAALKTGCDYALSSGARKIIVLDADGQHDPKEIPRFLDSLDEHEIVFGYRKGKEVMPKVLRFGNFFINKTMSSLFKVSIIDSQCGYRAFTANAYKKVRWNADDYYMETEMIIKTGKNKLKYQQIPIETIYSDNYKGTTVIDGVKIVTSSLFWRIFR